MKISIATFASAALVAASLTAVASAAAAPAARMGGAGGGPMGLCTSLGTSARAICSLCDASRAGRLYSACCSQRRAFELCAEAVAAADAAAAAPPPSVQRYVGGGMHLPPLPSGGSVEAGAYATAARADKRYGRMGIGRAAPLPPPRAPRGNTHQQSAKRADDEAASWSIEPSDIEAAAAPWYDGSDDSDGSYYYDYRDEAGDGGAGDDDRSDVEAAAGVGSDQLSDSLLDFLGEGYEKRFGSLGMRGGRR